MVCILPDNYQLPLCEGQGVSNTSDVCLCLLSDFSTSSSATNIFMYMYFMHLYFLCIYVFFPFMETNSQPIINSMQWLQLALFLEETVKQNRQLQTHIQWKISSPY